MHKYKWKCSEITIHERRRKIFLSFKNAKSFFKAFSAEDYFGFSVFGLTVKHPYVMSFLLRSEINFVSREK